MTRALRYSLKARADLAELFEFIAADNPVRARTYIDDIRQACQGLCDMPMLGKPRPDLRPGVYILPLWRRIVVAYALPPGRVHVLRVFSGGRDYEAIMAGD